ncbi:MULTISPECIES: alpha/beta fold hydrolase [unclassified Streptomyces]|uniref:alpha/beta fold hydrolase n=1 Tax=unclassified Streptomyces TaxID=2593676 RepID=UPI000886847D|nr:MULTISPECIES: alpha/beta hydrolase [unclassified Streptomyces]PBC82670.1 pimeloyl-ACP methyl ester carboxylesterase [Streptomyces sp. 2321.6]SDR48101.1 Pimeloyl-ACP methyl ester carboxylesterase [Streptomyces sp. KS_16]SEC67100.1 Pimeloyl-ACP methyl ester carboxylesterase [Streptomyces sp. 2133.1]SNC68745.1 Pimeloyl-ACP methyl ester carboxylesterase [Streptomyces sp. 2114.4]
MPHFRTYDDAELRYRVLGPADSPLPPLVCLAGGPGRDAAYLGDLGGMSAHRQLILPDSRGTGASPAAADPSRYAFPQLAEDVEALRAHLGLERFALLAHDAGAAVAQAYAARHPQRLTRLVLVCPGSRLQGELPDDAREIFAAREHEQWWPEASAAVRQLAETSDMDEVRALLFAAAPLGYGRWEEPQRAHASTEGEQLGPVPRAGFWQGVDEQLREALASGLSEVSCPVLVVTGDRDGVTGMRAGELVAESFPDARVRPLHGVGHYPWVDAPELFGPAVEEFLHAA